MNRFDVAWNGGVVVDGLRLIAARVRELREACGCPAAELASELSVAEDVYLAYEKEGADIPISVLYHVARKFRVDLGELLTGQASHLDAVCVVRQGNAPSVDRYPGYSFRSLAGGFSGKVMEPLLVTVEAGGDAAALVSHPGQEFNMILSGTIELVYNGRRILLDAGDCAYFDPNRPHGQRAANGRPATFLTVITE